MQIVGYFHSSLPYSQYPPLLLILSQINPVHATRSTSRRSNLKLKWPWPLQAPHIAHAKSHIFLHSLRSTKGSVPVRGVLKVFATSKVLNVEELLVPRPTPTMEYHPLSAVRDCLFNIFAATLRIWRPFLHPKPENTASRCDRDPLTT